MATSLERFRYGELLEGPYNRSMGFRLLEPADRPSWSAEVEDLARGLQAAPYPDHWPPAELFCSVLLADGRRLVAVARYGLLDHTPSRRRGGFELHGLLCPGDIDVDAALAIHRSLRRGGGPAAPSLEDLLASSPAGSPAEEPVPVLPIRIWQEGTLLFAATSPSDPDHRLGMLRLRPESSCRWQWLPLVGPDFPVGSWSARGPLIAWTPHLAGVAVKLDPKAGPPPRGRTAPWLLAGILLLLAGNLGVSLALLRRADPALPASPPTSAQAAPAPLPPPDDPFPKALYLLIERRGGTADWKDEELLAQYRLLAEEEPALRQSSREGQLAVGAAALLTPASPARVEALVREALAGKGFDPRLVDRACELVRERLAR